MAIVQRRKTLSGLLAFSVRIPPELKSKLERRAYNEEKSLGLLVEEILSTALNDASKNERSKNEAFK